MEQLKIIHVRFNDDNAAKFFARILDKVKTEKSESLSHLEKSQFFDYLEKSLDSAEEIN